MGLSVLTLMFLEHILIESFDVYRMLNEPFAQVSLCETRSNVGTLCEDDAFSDVLSQHASLQACGSGSFVVDDDTLWRDTMANGCGTFGIHMYLV